MHHPSSDPQANVQQQELRPQASGLNVLLQRCGSMDEEDAFAALYDAVASRAYGLACRVLRSPSHAEEVVQEAFVDVWRTASNFDPHRGTAQAWILTIVHRRAVDRVRSVDASRRRDQAHVDANAAVDHDSTGELAVAATEAQRVRAALSRLTAMQRQVIDLAYFGGQTHLEIAARLQIPVGTGKSRIRDALLRLREELQEQYDPDEPSLRAGANPALT